MTKTNGYFSKKLLKYWSRFSLNISYVNGESFLNFYHYNRYSYDLLHLGLKFSSQNYKSAQPAIWSVAASAHTRLQLQLRLLMMMILLRTIWMRWRREAGASHLHCKSKAVKGACYYFPNKSRVCSFCLVAGPCIGAKKRPQNFLKDSRISRTAGRR